MPMYHTYLENYDVVTRFNDPSGPGPNAPDLPYHETLARLMLDVLLSLSDSARLPLSAHHLWKHANASWTALVDSRSEQIVAMREDSDWRDLERAFESELNLMKQAAASFDALQTPNEYSYCAVHV